VDPQLLASEIVDLLIWPLDKISYPASYFNSARNSHELQLSKGVPLCDRIAFQSLEEDR
jgi:hypothetical protein